MKIKVIHTTDSKLADELTEQVCLHGAEKQGGKAQEKLNDGLQNFAQQVGIICALEHGHKIPPREAYHQIKALFKELKGLKRSAYPKKNEAS